MLVRLPGGRTLAVDAKVPLAAYLDAEAATDEASRNLALDRHAQQVSRHVNLLSAREYWAQLQPAPEMVVLFLAGDHFLSAALERDPDLLERALARKVLLATPVTLVSVLKGVSYGWRQERLAQNAGEIRRIAGEFYDRVRIFAEFYADSGRQLAKAVEAYNRSAGSWDARLLPSLKRMRELGVGAGDEAAQPAPDRHGHSRAADACSRFTSVSRASEFARRLRPACMMRQFFLFLSAHKGLRRWMETSSASKKFTRRFIAGETLDEALTVCERLQREGIWSTLDHLGENVTSIEEAAASRDAYFEALAGIAARQLQATVSMKLTQFGLDLSEDACLENVRALAARAKSAGGGIEIDMESTAYTDRTLRVVESVNARSATRVALFRRTCFAARPISIA